MVEPITTIGSFAAKSIASYALGKSLDKKISQWGTHERRLAKVIDQSIKEFHKKSPVPDSGFKSPFYRFNIFVAELIKVRLLGDNAYQLDESAIADLFSKNPNILLPTKKQLSDFLELLMKNVLADQELKKLEIDENYKEQVFFNSEKLNFLIEAVSKLVPKSTPKEITAVPGISINKIVGREQDLKNLRTSLLENRETVLVNGMGGIGKTTLAAVYVDTYYNDYDHIVWLTIENDLAEAIAANHSLLSNLKLKDIPAPNQLFECMNQLRSLQSEKPLLFIIDNASGILTSFFHVLPKPPGCHLLITSRERIEPFYIIELDFLPENKAIELFQKFNNKFSYEQIQSIIKAIEYHTLTIEILAKASKKHRWDFENMQDAVTRDEKAGIGVSHSQHQKIDRIKGYLSNIFKLSVKNKTDIYLLKQFLFLPNEWISYDFLESQLQKEQLEWGEDFSSTLESLYERGLVQKNETLDSYKMHPILAEAVYPQLEIVWDDISLLAESVETLLSLDQATENPIDKFLYIPFGDAILKQAKEHFAERLSVLKNNLGLRYQDLGKYEKAGELLELALQSAKDNFGENHPNVAVSQSNLALVYQDLGKYEKAGELLELALQSAKDNFGENHPTVAVRQSNLALVYQDLGKYEKAGELLELALQSNLDNFGGNHPNVAVRQSNLATVYRDLGKYEKAGELWQSSYLIFLDKLGEAHPNTETVKRIIESIRNKVT
ncbi:MAG: tetratricopeptide repeat protein [Candidatus Theseobacter exili]|nr:tetratricopeptide repeat protein [Candidatus Theseobacter exili]